MSSAPTWKPAGYTSVSPYLMVNDAEALIAFLAEVLGAERLRAFPRPDGSVMHAEVRIDDTVVMMGEATGDWPVQPAHLHVYVPDVDAAFARAVERGAEVVEAPNRKPGDGDRRGGVRGPSGHTWWFSTQVAED